MNKILKIIIWPVVALPAIYLAIKWNDLPQQVAIHFRLDGTPDRFGNKIELVIMLAVLTVVNIGLYLLMANIHRIDRRGNGKTNQPRLERMAFSISVFIAGLTFYIIYNSIKGVGVHFSPNLVFGAIGLLWCIMGNYMHNIKPNYFAGFRTKWTLNNEENWKKTHLLGGKLWFVGGLLLAIVCLFSRGNVVIFIFMFVTLVITIIPFIYSYGIYKKQKAINPVN